MSVWFRASSKTAIIALAMMQAIGMQALPAQAETTLERIKAAKVVTVGTEAAFPPFEYVEDGKIVGFGKDILDQIVQDTGVSLNQLDTPFAGLLPGLLAGKFDFVATAMPINKDFASKFAFTMPISEGGSGILRRKGDTSMNTTADFDGKIVGIQVGTSREKILRAQDAQLKSQGKPGIEIKLFNSTPEAIVALGNSQVDAVISLTPQLRAFVATQPDAFEYAGPIDPGQHEYIGWITRPDDKELRDYLSSEIKKLRDNGKLYEFQEKWFGVRMPIPDSGYLPEGAQ